MAAHGSQKEKWRPLLATNKKQINCAYTGAHVPFSVFLFHQIKFPIAQSIKKILKI